MSGYGGVRRAGPGGLRRGRSAGQGQGRLVTEPGRPELVINCVRSGKDRVKNFVICFTSSPSTANERPVIPFVNLTGYPHRDRGAATGSCTARGTSPASCPRG